MPHLRKRLSLAFCRSRCVRRVRGGSCCVRKPPSATQATAKNKPAATSMKTADAVPSRSVPTAFGGSIAVTELRNADRHTSAETSVDTAGVKAVEVRHKKATTGQMVSTAEAFSNAAGAARGGQQGASIHTV